MASFYVPLSPAQYPSNALMDFSPIRQLAVDRRNQAALEYQRARDQELLEYNRKRDAFADDLAQKKFDFETTKPTFSSVGEGETLVATYPNGERKSIYSSGYTPSVAEGIFRNGNNEMPTTFSAPTPQASNQFTGMSPTNFKMPIARSAQSITNEGPHSYYGTSLVVPDTVNKPSTMQSVQNAPNGMIKTPFGNITQEQFFKISQSKKPFDQAVVKNVLENQKDANAGIFKTPKERFDIKQALRKEFKDVSQEYMKLRDSYSKIKEAALSADRDQSGASDMALIYAFMKMLDPPSVVRETEFAAALKATGFYNQLGNMLEQFKTGQKVAYNRQDYLNLAKRLADAQEKMYKGMQEEYAGFAKNEGIDPKEVYIDISIPRGPEDEELFNDKRTPLPQKGKVENGSYDYNPSAGSP